jgi:hypothetical protein
MDCCAYMLPRHGPRRKHSLSIVQVSFLIHSLAMDCCAYMLPRQCVYRVVAFCCTSQLLNVLGFP